MCLFVMQKIRNAVQGLRLSFDALPIHHKVEAGNDFILCLTVAFLYTPFVYVTILRCRVNICLAIIIPVVG